MSGVPVDDGETAGEREDRTARGAGDSTPDAGDGAGDGRETTGDSRDAPEGGERVELDRRPPTLAVTLALSAAGVAVAAVLLGGSALAVAPAAVGLLAILGGTAVASRRILTLGAVSLLAAVVLGAAVAPGLGAEATLVAVVGALLAWDVGQHGIEIGEQIGRTVPSARLVLVHVAGSLLVGTVAAAFAYGVFVVAAAGQPVTAVVFLLLGVVALVAALT